MSADFVDIPDPHSPHSVCNAYPIWRDWRSGWYCSRIMLNRFKGFVRDGYLVPVPGFYKHEFGIYKEVVAVRFAAPERVARALEMP
jgi:hypothetical protein